MLNIDIISCLNDNYSYLIHDTSTDLVGVVDPSEFEPIDQFLEKKYKKLDFILNTHHHADHVGGNVKLKKKYKSKIAGCILDQNRIPKVDILLKENEIFNFGNTRFKIIFTPGHTSGHIIFYSKKDNVLFTGDTLFSLGCGRIFEGSYKQMFNSLKKIKELPKETKIYCGHEYTKNNYEFCFKYDNENKYLEKKIEWIKQRLIKNLPTLPVTLENELKENIFLRCDNSSLKSALQSKNVTEEEIFKKLRDLKDSF
jgi:hydroxyacylglutathione hydrolase